MHFQIHILSLNTMRKPYQHNGAWCVLVAIFLLISIIPIKGLSQQPQRPRPYKILAKSIEKYEQASNGHYLIKLASTSIYAADTTRIIVEGYYSFKEVGAKEYPLIQQITTESESGNWGVEKTRGDTVSMLSSESEQWSYYLMTNRDRARFLLTNHGLTPFTHPRYYLSQLSPLVRYSKETSTQVWVIASGPYKVWIGKEDTLVHRIDYRGSKRRKYYRRIDILHQEFDRPEYDGLDLYRHDPTDSSWFALLSPTESPLLSVAPVQPGAPLHLPSLPTTRGDTVSLTDFQGKVVLLDFWYIGCKPCADGLPALQRLHEKYKDQGLVVIGLEVVKTDPEQINRFLEARGVEYLQWYGPQIKESGILTQIHSYPTHFLIDREGNIAEIGHGYSPSIVRKSERRIVELLEAER